MGVIHENLRGSLVQLRAIVGLAVEEKAMVAVERAKLIGFSLDFFVYQPKVIREGVFLKPWEKLIFPLIKNHPYLIARKFF